MRSRPAWLEPVWSDANWQVLRVRDAVPLVSAPGSALCMMSAEVDVRVPRPGPAAYGAGRVLTVAARAGRLPDTGTASSRG